MPNDDVASQTVKTAETATKQAIVVRDEGEFSMLMDSGKFAQLQRIGTMYARSKMVPAHFQGDEPSCMVAVQMAMRLNIDPFMFLQKTYVVGGKPGMEAPLVIALINTRGPFKGPVNWDLKRDDKGDVIECTAYATHRETGTVCSSTVTWKMVEAEGWSKKNGSKWLTLREQMFKYRSAAFLGRLYCPEVLMGMATADELVDQEIDVTPAPERTEPPARRSLKDRVVDASPAEPPTTEQLVESGHIVIHDEPKDAPQPSQAVGSGPQAAGDAPTPRMPYDSLLRLAKKAASQDQSDVVLDALNDPAYTLGQRDEVKAILNSKVYAAGNSK
jgi:hypothetical protein